MAPSTLPPLVWFNTIAIVSTVAWLGTYVGTHRETKQHSVVEVCHCQPSTPAPFALPRADGEFRDPSVVPALQSDDPRRRVARCSGSLDGRDGVGPATVYRGSVVLDPEADLVLKMVDGSTSLSLRDALQALSAKGIYTQNTSTSDQCYYWSENVVRWREQAIEQKGDSLYCDTDGVGNSCEWRTDWFLPACHPRHLLCVCPSTVVLGLTIETIGFQGLAMADRGKFWANHLALCQGSRSLADFDMSGQQQVTTAACAMDPSYSMCDPWTSRAAVRAWASPLPIWPPVSAPATMLAAYRLRQKLRLRIENPSCDNNRSWVTSIPADTSRLELTCNWESAAQLTVGVSSVVDLDPSLWYLYGVAVTLTDTASSHVLADVCFAQQRLRSCSDLTWSYSRTVAGDAILRSTLSGPTRLVSRADWPIPIATLVVEDVY
jgi:hypothetical protein